MKKTNPLLKSRKVLVGSLVALLLGAPVFPLQSMTMNMATKYSSKPSPPHDERLVFWSPQNDVLLFENENTIEIRCRAGVRALGLKWSLSRNRFKKTFLNGTAEALPENGYVIRIPTQNLKPGFYDLRVELDSGDEKRIPGICVFGYQASKIPSTLNRPDDFKQFWEKGKQELSQIPLDPKTGEVTVFKGSEIDAYNLAHAGLPGDYDPQGHRTDEVESCKINLAGPNGTRIYGWLAKPKGAGPFPAILVVPGAGFNARPRPLEHARHGYIAMEVQVHGQDVDLEKYEKYPGYYDHFIFNPPEDYYYRKVYLNALQALNYLFSREDVDKKRVAVAGGSQGGRLAVILAALEPRVAASVSTIANSGNVPYLEWAENSTTDGMERDTPPPLPDPVEERCRSYYDPMNFAPDVKCPILMDAGLIDPVSPPASVFPVYFQIGSKDKQMVPLPGLGHDWSAEFDRRAWRWLDKKLNSTSVQKAD